MINGGTVLSLMKDSGESQQTILPHNQVWGAFLQ